MGGATAPRRAVAKTVSIWALRLPSRIATRSARQQ